MIDFAPTPGQQKLNCMVDAIVCHTVELAASGRPWTDSERDFVRGFMRSRIEAEPVHHILAAFRDLPFESRKVALREMELV